MQKYPSIAFKGEVIYWRGPAPYYFVRLPEEKSQIIAKFANEITYGWGVIPADATIGKTDFYTALFPKDGGYLLPLKKAIRDELKIDLGDTVSVTLNFERQL